MRIRDVIIDEDRGIPVFHRGMAEDVVLESGGNVSLPPLLFLPREVAVCTTQAPFFARAIYFYVASIAPCSL